MAGLVGGDSDSSALTQESGDEGTLASPRSASPTEGGTEEVDEEDAEMREPSPGEYFRSYMDFVLDIVL
jgi:MRG-binding protein